LKQRYKNYYWADRGSLQGPKTSYAILMGNAQIFCPS
jgi:hypothetical protein